MAFSLSNWFKGKPDGSDQEFDETPAAPRSVAAPASHVAPPPSVRTATPTAAAPAQPPPAPVSLRTATPSGRRTVSVPPAKLPVSSKVTPSLASARKVAFPTGATPAPAPASTSPMPMRPAMSASPVAPTTNAPEMTVSLEIGDFLDRLPASLVQAGSFDRKQKVDFQASELYSDLSKGRASVPASVIYQRCPEIFSRPVTETEDVEVPLPLRKLVEQMGTALSTRTDQVEEENVGQIETPFLQVAMEDNARLPTATGSAAGAVRPMQPLTSAPGDQGGLAPTRPHRTGQISTISPPKTTPDQPPLAPPTAATSGPIIPGKRPPSTVRASVAGGKIRLSGPAAVNRMSPVTPSENGDGKSKPGTHSQRINLPVMPASPSHQVAKKTARIQIPPISLRTGGPNTTPRTGPTPPKPEAAPATTEGTANLRPPTGKDTPPAPPPITFRTSPPTARPVPPSFAPPRGGSAFPPPSFPAVPPAAPKPPVPAAPDDRKIELGLAAILRSMPSAMLAVEPSSVPDDVRVSLPFALIEPQLSLGRVSISRETFVQALPEAHRQVLAADTEASEVPLPLQEVFQHLPTNALTMRVDQVMEEVGSYYPTPFSQKADEDAQRFNVSTPVPPPVSQAAEPEPPVAETVAESPTDQTDVSAEPARDVPLGEEKLSSPAMEAQASTEAEAMLESAPEPSRDIPLDKVEPPAVETVTEPSRDIPLDLQDEAPAEPILAPSSPVSEAPVESPEAAAPIAIKAEPEAPEETAAEPLPLPALAVAATPTEEAPVAEKDAEPIATESPAAFVPIKEMPAASVRAVAAQDSALQTLFMTEDELDAKAVVKLVCQLPGVNGCAIMFEDGLSLAGNFPDGDTEGFSAMAAPFYKRAARFVAELELGQLYTFTLHTSLGLHSFFMQDNICVSVRHTGRGFMPGVREKLEIVTQEMARIYATAKPTPTAD